MKISILVSIIIPVFNNKNGLKKTLEAINNQNFSKEKFEVIVVDNGSFDDPITVVHDYEDRLLVRFLTESEYVGSPYSARNRGIECSSGEIIVLLDSTCAPTHHWLTSGIRMIESGADLVAGKVSFEINEKSGVGEIYDSLSNVKMKKTVEERKAAKAGNLFIKKKVIDHIGFFPEGLRSGGDVRWTYQATKSGFKLTYSDSAEVYIKPKKLRSLFNKQFRVGKGQPEIWLESNSFIKNVFRKVILCWVPPNPIQLKKWIKESEHSFIASKFIQLYGTGWVLRVVNGLGNIIGIAGLARNKN